MLSIVKKLLLTCSFASAFSSNIYSVHSRNIMALSMKSRDISSKSNKNNNDKNNTIDVNDNANFKPLQIGLTGSIGMGKSTVTNHLRNLGFQVFDADATVHALYDTNGDAVEPVRSLFPDAVIQNKVDRNSKKTNPSLVQIV